MGGIDPSLGRCSYWASDTHPRDKARYIVPRAVTQKWRDGGLHAPRIQLTSANDETRPTAVGGSATDNAAFFRGDDDYWSISYHDTVLRLRDAKGLRYIARLLHNPGVGFAARELMRIAATPTVGVGESAFEAAPKRDEQARLGVTKRIKAVIKRIEVEHPILAYHLSVSIKTGAYCIYRPDPAHPVVWRSE